MDQPGIEQRPLKMINGITTEFGQVLFDDARVPVANMVGLPGEGWALAMTTVGPERCRRLSDRLDGVSLGPRGSIDKLLMT